MADKEGSRTVGSSRSSSSHSSIGEDSAGTPPDVQTSNPGLSPRKPSQGYQCQLCTFIASTTAAFDEHMNIHTGSRPYQCLECGFSCSLHSTLQQHLAVHRIDMTSSMLLDRHMPDISKVRDLPPPLMPEVSRGIPLHVTTSAPPPSMDGLNSLSALSPFSEHGRVYQCKLCTHISPTKTHLNEHMNVHSGKKPYKCLVCGFSSAFRSSLMRHLIVHTGTSKQFKCDQCHYQTPYKCNLQAHRRKRHNVLDGGGPMPPLSMPSDSSPTFHAQNNTSSPSEDGLYKAPRYTSEGKSLSDTSGNHDNGPPPLSHAMMQREGSPYNGSDDDIRETDMGNGKMPPNSNISLPQSDIASLETLSPQKASPGSSIGQPQEAPAQDALDYSGNASPHLSTREVNDSDSNQSVPLRAGIATSAAISMSSSSPMNMVSSTPISPQQPLPPNESAPHWANFPIFRRKKEGGARKRKRTPFPKRELLMSPEREHGTELWIDTRSDVPTPESQAAAFASGAHHPLGVKAEDGVPMPGYPHQPMVNGIDLSGSPRDLQLYKYPQGVILNARSPGDMTPDSDENPAHGRPYFQRASYEGGEAVTDNGDVSTSGAQAGDKAPKSGSSSGSGGSAMEEEGKADGQAQTEWMGGDPVGIPHQAVKCPHCETFFTDHVIFTLHMSCHGARHPFQCSICGYVCRDKIEFTCHVTRSQHIR